MLRFTSNLVVGISFLYSFPLLAFSLPSSNSYFEPRTHSVETRLQQRRACHKDSQHPNHLNPFEKPDQYNQAKYFLKDNLKYTNLYSMEQSQLLDGELDNVPWSGDYWPYASGLLGSRFADEDFFQLSDWKEKYDYIFKHPAAEIYATGKTETIDKLSVSEKYDLLTNKHKTPLTDQMWKQGKEIFDHEGEVEEWMGLCHGWAASAIMAPRPHKKTQMVSADGTTPITFYPDELKALLSYAWAQAQFPTHFVGRRCQEKNPPEDEEGRFSQPECKDLNPATWHLVVVNQIGFLKESFVMDATYGYEVWNQPVFSYGYSYFNPKDGQTHSHLDEAKIKVEDFSEDPYKKHRHPQTKYIVGIDMTLGYVAESLPVQKSTDSGQYDNHHLVRYFYDLELSEEGEILGGEWYQKEHPDFLWKPAPEASARNIFDLYVSKEPISSREPLNQNWQKVLNQASSYGLLVYSLVEYLSGIDRNE